MAVAGMIAGNNSAEVPLVAAAVNSRVAVQELAPFTCARKTDAVMRTRNGRKIQDYDVLTGAIGGLAQE